MVKIEEIKPITVYCCPICNHEETNYDKALKHANIVKDFILPNGLVYIVTAKFQPIWFYDVLKVQFNDFHQALVHKYCVKGHNPKKFYGGHYIPSLDYGELYRAFLSRRNRPMTSKELNEFFLTNLKFLRFLKTKGIEKLTSELPDLTQEGGQNAC